MLMGACAIATILFQPDENGKEVLPDTDWDLGFEFEDVATKITPDDVSVVQYLCRR